MLPAAERIEKFRLPRNRLHSPSPRNARNSRSLSRLPGQHARRAAVKLLRLSSSPWGASASAAMIRCTCHSVGAMHHAGSGTTKALSENEVCTPLIMSKTFPYGSFVNLVRCSDDDLCGVNKCRRTSLPLHELLVSSDNLAVFLYLMPARKTEFASCFTKIASRSGLLPKVELLCPYEVTAVHGLLALLCKFQWFGRGCQYYVY